MVSSFPYSSFESSSSLFGGATHSPSILFGSDSSAVSSSLFKSNSATAEPAFELSSSASNSGSSLFGSMLSFYQNSATPKFGGTSTAAPGSSLLQATGPSYFESSSSTDTSNLTIAEGTEINLELMRIEERVLTTVKELIDENNRRFKQSFAAIIDEMKSIRNQLLPKAGETSTEHSRGNCNNEQHFEISQEFMEEGDDTSKVEYAIFMEAVETDSDFQEQISIGDEDSSTVDVEAKNQYAMNTINIVSDVKRSVGRRYSESSVQGDMKLWLFKVISDLGNKPAVIANYKKEEKQFFAEVISSKVFAKKVLIFDPGGAPILQALRQGL